MRASSAIRWVPSRQYSLRRSSSSAANRAGACCVRSVTHTKRKFLDDRSLSKMTGFESLRARHAADFETMLPEHLARLRWSSDALRAERERGLRALFHAAKAGSP